MYVAAMGGGGGGGGGCRPPGGGPPGDGPPGGNGPPGGGPPGGDGPPNEPPRTLEQLDGAVYDIQRGLVREFHDLISEFRDREVKHERQFQRTSEQTQAQVLELDASVARVRTQV